MSASMLARWRSCKNEFAAYERFLAALEERGIHLCDASGERILKTPREVIAEYLEIDLKQLEEERRALTEAPPPGESRREITVSGACAGCRAGADERGHVDCHPTIAETWITRGWTLDSETYESSGWRATLSRPAIRPGQLLRDRRNGSLHAVVPKASADVTLAWLSLRDGAFVWAPDVVAEHLEQLVASYYEIVGDDVELVEYLRQKAAGDVDPTLAARLREVYTAERFRQRAQRGSGEADRQTR